MNFTEEEKGLGMEIMENKDNPHNFAGASSALGYNSPVNYKPLPPSPGWTLRLEILG